MMTIKRFKELFENTDSDLLGYKKCNAYLGLAIIAKYSNIGIAGADYDIIYSVDVEDLVDADITEEDVIELRKLNWMIQNGEYLACFV